MDNFSVLFVSLVVVFGTLAVVSLVSAAKGRKRRPKGCVTASHRQPGRESEVPHVRPMR